MRGVNLTASVGKKQKEIIFVSWESLKTAWRKAVNLQRSLKEEIEKIADESLLGD